MLTKDTQLSYFNTDKVPDAKDLSFSIIVSEWNSDITEALYNSAYKTLVDFGVNPNDINRVDVPGSYELVFGTRIAAKRNPDAIICLGSVIQGETKHFDFICNAVAQGIKDLNIILDIPVIFGVLTDNTIQQAIDRSGGKYGNKGVEAAISAIKMANLNR